MWGAAAKNTKSKLATALQITLLAFCRGMCFFSSRFSGFAGCFCFAKNRAQKEKSHRQYGSGGGILKLPGL
jgi:hypothetical protein